MQRPNNRKIFGIVAASFSVVLIALGANAYHHLAWAGDTESVSFQSVGDRISLHGLLVKPAGTPPYPAMVVMHGSGSADGSHDLPGYRVHANAFARRGFAVLLYDKRGIGDSEGSFDDATYGDFVSDGLSAVQYLRSRDDINALRIGLLGTSEGGWLTPEVAATSGDIAFIVNKCGPPISWKETVLFEIENDIRANGIEEGVIQESLELRKRIWQYYADAASDSTLASGSVRDELNQELATLGSKASADDLELPEELPEYDQERYVQITADVSYDPTPFLRQLDIPLLYIFGGKDVNIPTTKCVEALRRLKPNATVKVYPDLGHSLMTWRGTLSGLYAPGYLDLISDWAKQQAGLR